MKHKGSVNEFYKNDRFRREILHKEILRQDNFFQGKTVLYILLRFLKQGLLLLPPYCYLLFLNEVITKHNFQILWLILGFYVLIYMLKAFLSVLEKMVSNRIYPPMQSVLKEKLLRKYGEMDIKVLHEYSAGELKERLHKDTENVVLYEKSKLELCISVIHIVILTGILLYLNWILAVISFLLLPLSFIMTRYVKGRSNTEYTRKRELQGSYNDFMIHTMHFSFWKDMKANRLEEMQQKQFGRHWNGLGDAFLKAHICWFLNRTFLAFKDVFLTQMSLYLFGGILVVNQMGTVPVLLSFMQYYNDFTNVFLSMSDIWMKRGEQEESLRRVTDIYGIPFEERPVKITQLDALELVNVDFTYPGEREQILHHFCLKIEKGESIALTGESGCGKSTLIQLISGCLTPERGEILWNGYPMERIDRKSIYETAGFLMQESYLFHLTIRENLLMGKIDASEAEMMEACVRANIMDFIQELPKGLETQIGENGIRLSGGQKQRLLIARLLLKNPEFIVFDEATSGLDYQNEREILELLLEQMEGKTFLMVTHRGTSVARCSRVVTL